MINHRLLVLSASLLCFSVLAFTSNSPAQTGEPSAPSYEVFLQVLVGSDNASGPALPASLSNVSRHLRSNLLFDKYLVTTSIIGRIDQTGHFEYKSTGDLGFGGSPGEQSFIEWTVGGLRAAPEGVGQRQLKIQPFRFAARVPVKYPGGKDEGGKPVLATNYESIGLNVNLVSLQENVPTLIGSLSLPGSTRAAFLVLTVKPAIY